MNKKESHQSDRILDIDAILGSNEEIDDDFMSSDDNAEQVHPPSQKSNTDFLQTKPISDIDAILGSQDEDFYDLSDNDEDSKRHLAPNQDLQNTQGEPKTQILDINQILGDDEEYYDDDDDYSENESNVDVNENDGQNDLTMLDINKLCPENYENVVHHDEAPVISDIDAILGTHDENFYDLSDEDISITDLSIFPNKSKAKNEILNINKIIGDHKVNCENYLEDNLIVDVDEKAEKHDNTMEICVKSNSNFSQNDTCNSMIKPTFSDKDINATINIHNLYQITEEVIDDIDKNQITEADVKKDTEIHTTFQYTEDFSNIELDIDKNRYLPNIPDKTHESPPLQPVNYNPGLRNIRSDIKDIALDSDVTEEIKFGDKVDIPSIDTEENKNLNNLDVELKSYIDFHDLENNCNKKISDKFSIETIKYNTEILKSSNAVQNLDSNQEPDITISMVIEKQKQNAIFIVRMPKHWFINESESKSKYNTENVNNGTFLKGEDKDKYSVDIYIFGLNENCEVNAEISTFNIDMKKGFKNEFKNSYVRHEYAKYGCKN